MSKNTKTIIRYSKIVKDFDIASYLIDGDVSYRGGTIKIDVSELFPSITGDGDEAIMGAYQNYLGGGLAGAIVGAAMFNPEQLTKKERVIFEEVKEKIKRYFYTLNNGGGDEVLEEMGLMDYQKNQHLPVSAY